MFQFNFFDLPVYRLSDEDYNKWIAEETSKQLMTWKLMGETPPSHIVESVGQHINERYGAWRFNEIVGYIRLHFLGTQIRGEYYSAEKRRTRLSRTKVFKYRHWKLASEVSIHSPNSSEEVWAKIEEYIARCQKELRRGRHIDASTLRDLAPHVDWLGIYHRRQSPDA